MVSLRSSCYRFLWGIVARNPFACAKLARILRKIQDVWNLQGSKLHATVASMAYYWAYYHSKSMTSIQSLVCLNWPLQARGPTYQENNATRKQRNLSPISSRPIMLCNPFRCNYIHSFLFQFSTWFQACAKLARTWACAKLVKGCARVTPFNFKE